MIIMNVFAITLCVVIGVFIARREYAGLSQDDKVKFREELRNPIPILLSGMIYLGYLTVFISILLDLIVLRYVAFFLMGIGFIVKGAEEWKLNVSKAILFLILGGLITVITALMATKHVW